MNEWPPSAPYSPQYERLPPQPIYAMGQPTAVAHRQGPRLVIPTNFGIPYLYDRQLTDVDLMRVWMGINF